MTAPPQIAPGGPGLLEALLRDQGDLTAVERFARDPACGTASHGPAHRALIPLSAPKPGEQYAFTVDLDRCSGCKSCVTACHALNGLDEEETWRSVGLLHSRTGHSYQQTITTACHHCVEPACLTGCPVLAYDKDPLTGIVRHLDDQCIGCQYCVLMCPYEVPRYSARLGIVRKCDMCHQRLAQGEAPACAQACPSEAISITLSSQTRVRDEFRTGDDANHGPNRWLPGAPHPGLTLPTTRYVSGRPIPADAIAGDSQEARFQPAHLPLVGMLVLTQLGVGGMSLLALSSPAERPALAGIATAATWLGLAASVLHLGRPQKAWRVFLGLRHSWLSREVIAFGLFALLSLLTTIIAVLGPGAAWEPALLCATTVVGLAAVFCSGMTYHVTRRESWRGELSLGRFFGTTLVLGSAAAWVAATLSGHGRAVFPALLTAAMMGKLARELASLRRCPDDADLEDELPVGLPARSAFLMRFRMGKTLRLRLACAWCGGVALPLFGLLACSSSAAVALPALLLCLAGESAERLLFFRTVALAKMPGPLSS